MLEEERGSARKKRNSLQSEVEALGKVKSRSDPEGKR